jgi:hypothetical protein
MFREGTGNMGLIDGCRSEAFTRLKKILDRCLAFRRRERTVVSQGSDMGGGAVGGNKDAFILCMEVRQAVVKRAKAPSEVGRSDIGGAWKVAARSSWKAVRVAWVQEVHRGPGSSRSDHFPNCTRRGSWSAAPGTWAKDGMQKAVGANNRAAVGER